VKKNTVEDGSNIIDLSENAPIALFAYKRLGQLRRTVQSLLTNPEASASELYVFCDGAKDDVDLSAVSEVREFAANIKGFRSVSVVLRHKNVGLARNIIDGVSKVTELHGRAIVIEDDLLLSQYFLRYMNDGLNLYSDDERVISIHGYVYPVQQALPEAFFLRGADCWGWATWRRGWALFNPDGQALLDELRRLNLTKAFDFNGAYSYSQMLEGQINGKNDSWAIRWYASAFLADKLTLYPGRSLVHNIGNDGSGTHCGSNAIHDVELSNSLINLSGVEVRHSELGFSAFERFFRDSKTTQFSKVRQRVKYALSKVFA
jgi:hypothetical protein